MNAHPPLTWGPKPHCAGLFASSIDYGEVSVVLTSQGWSASVGDALLSRPIPGPLWASQAEAMDAVARAVGCAPLAPVCPACHGYGSADGLPCGTHERDFGSEAPAACGACGGSGLVSPTPPPQPHPEHPAPWVVGERYEQDDPGIFIWSERTGLVVLTTSNDTDLPLTRELADRIVAAVNKAEAP